MINNKIMDRRTIIKLLFVVLAVILIVIFLKGNSLKMDSDVRQPAVISRTEFEVVDKMGNKIDYGREYLADGKIDSVRERIFSRLDQDLTVLVESGEGYPLGKVIYTANQSQRGAIAIFNFSDNKKIILDTYIESSLFDIPIIDSEFIDFDADGNKDIFMLSHSGNYLDIERPWVFLSRGEEYVLATPLEPSGVNTSKALSGEVSAQNSMEIRAQAGSQVIWVRDLDGDNKLEIITLDKGTFSDDAGDSLTKKIYKLSGDIFTLQSEAKVVRGSSEYNEIRSWPAVPASNNI